MKWGEFVGEGAVFSSQISPPGRYHFTKAATFAEGEAILWHRRRTQTTGWTWCLADDQGLRLYKSTFYLLTYFTFPGAGAVIYYDTGIWLNADSVRFGLSSELRPMLRGYTLDTVRYDTIAEFNVDWKAEY